MNQLTFFKYAVIAFLFMNAVTVVFLFLQRDQRAERPRPGPPPNKGAVSILNLNPDQEILFEEAAKKHQEIIGSIDAKQKDLLSPYFTSLINENQSVNQAERLDELKHLEGLKIQSTYEHFEQIKAILNEEQLKNFDEFMTGALSNILNAKKRGPPPRQDF